MYESRLPVNYAFGTLSSAAAVSDTTLSSAEFATLLPAGLSTTVYVPITVQDAATKLYEVVWATAHTAAATTATVVRGREGSTARAWASGTQWLVGPTVRDTELPVANRAALPADPHIGMRVYLQDEQVALTWVLNAGWVQDRGTECHAAYKASVSQTCTSHVLRKVFYGTTLASSALVTATLGTASTGSYFTLNRAGVWSVEGGALTGSAAGLNIRDLAVVDETNLGASYRSQTAFSNDTDCALNVGVVRRFAAGARVAIAFYQQQGSNLDLVAADATGVSLTWLGP